MPNTKAAIKRVRADRKLHAANVQIKSELKTLARRVNESIEAKDAEKAQKALQTLNKRLDQAAQKGVIHRNTSSRRKSTYARRVGRAFA